MNYVKLILGLLVFLGTLGALLVGGGTLWGIHQFTKPGPLTETTLIEIPRGTGLNTISSKLYYVKSIERPWLFKAGVLISGKQSVLQAGEYELQPHMSAREIMNLLASGQVVERRFTIPEGLTSFEIVRLLRGIEALEGEIAAIPDEGALLPQTYDYRLNESRAAIIARLEQAMTALRQDLAANPTTKEISASSPQGQQEETATTTTAPHPSTPSPPIVALCKIKQPEGEGIPENILHQALQDDTCWHKIITLASIVEKETGVSEERQRVAGVFLNRLARGIPLQTDPTVIYAITKGQHKNEGKGPLGRRLLRKDLEFDSPYNTYKYPGLPPGPIANPGRASIEAVLWPETHAFIYFVADGTGGHVFSKTLKEHNANAAKWRKIRRAKKN